MADFGVSKRVIGGNTSLHTSLTRDFMAPEVLGFVDEIGKYTNAVNMWSLGTLASWLMTQRVLVDVSKMFLFSKGRFDLPLSTLPSKSISVPGVDFVSKLLIYQPHLRLIASAAISHEWLHQAMGKDRLVDDSSAISRDSVEFKRDGSSQRHEKKPAFESEDGANHKGLPGDGEDSLDSTNGNVTGRVEVVGNEDHGEAASDRQRDQVYAGSRNPLIKSKNAG